jgi:hypothetical protein
MPIHTHFGDDGEIISSEFKEPKLLNKKNKRDMLNDLVSKYGIEEVINKQRERGELNGKRIYEANGLAYTWDEWRDEGLNYGEDLTQLLHDWHQSPKYTRKSVFDGRLGETNSQRSNRRSVFDGRLGETNSQRNKRQSSNRRSVFDGRLGETNSQRSKRQSSNRRSVFDGRLGETNSQRSKRQSSNRRSVFDGRLGETNSQRSKRQSNTKGDILPTLSTI